MYLCVSRQKRAERSHITHLQFAESALDPASKRSRVRIAYNFGRAEDPQVIEWLRRLANSILKWCAPEGIVAQDPAWQLVNAWPYGDLYVLEALWQQLGIAEVIAEVVGRRKMDFLEENQETIEERLYYRLVDLLNLDVDLVFYDAT